MDNHRFRASAQYMWTLLENVSGVYVFFWFINEFDVVSSLELSPNMILWKWLRYYTNRTYNIPYLVSNNVQLQEYIKPMKIIAETQMVHIHRVSSAFETKQSVGANSFIRRTNSRCCTTLCAPFALSHHCNESWNVQNRYFVLCSFISRQYW